MDIDEEWKDAWNQVNSETKQQDVLERCELRRQESRIQDREEVDRKYEEEELAQKVSDPLWTTYGYKREQTPYGYYIIVPDEGKMSGVKRERP